MKIKETPRFVLHYDDSLESFIEKSLKIADEKVPVIEDLFDCKQEKIGKIKASFFTERQDFVSYIQSITNGHTPPELAIGCFYNGEIQTLLNLENRKQLENNTHTLTHELTHLFIDKLIYQKHNISRIRWFDESFANFLDGSQDLYTEETIKNLCKRLESFKDFNLFVLNDIKQVKTETYNGYDMFILVGRYIFEQNLQKTIIEKIIKNDNEILEEGKTILAKALDYFAQKN